MRSEDGLKRAETCSCNHSRPERPGRPGQTNNLAPLKTDIIETFAAWNWAGETFCERGGILSLVETWVYYQNVTDYSRDILEPLVRLALRPAARLARPIARPWLQFLFNKRVFCLPDVCWSPALLETFVVVTRTTDVLWDVTTCSLVKLCTNISEESVASIVSL
jgi:hypothetical protein